MVLKRRSISNFATTDELVTGIYAHMQNMIGTVRSENRVFHLALAGGSTPRSFYRYLANRSRGEIPWQDIHLWWGDERCVPPDHIESNYRMVKETLLDHVGVPDVNIHRIHGESDPESESLRYGREIGACMRLSDKKSNTFDLILLGIGEDGHTASIFTDSDINAGRDNCCAVTVHPVSGQNRITLTLPVINRSRSIIFMATGAAKARVVARILNKDPDGRSMPAFHVKPAKGQLCWYIDNDAAAYLETGCIFDG